ncbi:MAG: membrane dipeptidase [Isosphaeraceae bacterium]|nr:membrane dipeptidase [Isosphaeraceae bacterium]
MPAIFDGHLDLAWNALSWGRDQTLPLDELNRIDAQLQDHPARGRATTSLPEMRAAGIRVCQATILCRAKPNLIAPSGHSRMSLDFATQSIAYAAGRGQLAYYELLETQGEIRFIRTRGDLDAHLASLGEAPGDGYPIGLILAMEGADPIVEPEQAEHWWNLGLRSVNLAHYGASRYAVGTGDDGPVTPEGFRLLAEFERLGMILDATHLSDTSFDQALDAFGGPVLASHNNVRALVPDQRQFSDDQIRKLFARRAVIGVALDAWMLAPGWIRGTTNREVVALDALADHIDYYRNIAGHVDFIAIGSDLDGGFGTEQTPTGLDRIRDLQSLAGILSSRGYSDDEIEAIFHGNWTRFFREHLPQ